MSNTIRDMAKAADEAATAQRIFLEARDVAAQWLDQSRNLSMPVVILAATMVQAMIGQKIGGITGQDASQVIAALGQDMRQLADLIEPEA